MNNLQIIHLGHRFDREALLIKELEAQCIVDYTIWPGIIENVPFKGVSKAHKQIVEWAMKKGLSHVTIAEDDICFTDRGAYDYFIQNEPNDYDLYLGGITHGIKNERNEVFDFSGLTLYRVKQTFYRTFLSVSDNGNIDRMLNNKGRYIVCNPFVVKQHDGYSDNLKREMKYGVYYQGRAFFRNPHVDQ